jgi:GST-like protein
MGSNNTYTPPKIWKWEKPRAEEHWRYAGINRPVAGPTYDAQLPVGKHPLQLYSRGTPNGVKVTVMLEELLALGHSGAEYDAWLIDIGKGEQFGSGFVAMNPNSKIPTLVDRSGAKPRRVFESGSILLYLAEKFGAFLPSDLDRRTEVLNWLFWQMGSRPTSATGLVISITTRLSIEYAIQQVSRWKPGRQLDVLNRHLGEHEEYSGAGDEFDHRYGDWPGSDHLDTGCSTVRASSRRAVCVHVIRWTKAIAERPPAVRRAGYQPRRRRSRSAVARTP